MNLVESFLNVAAPRRVRTPYTALPYLQLLNYYVKIAHLFHFNMSFFKTNSRTSEKAP